MHACLVNNAISGIRRQWVSQPSLITILHAHYWWIERGISNGRGWLIKTGVDAYGSSTFLNSRKEMQSTSLSLASISLYLWYSSCNAVDYDLDLANDPPATIPPPLDYRIKERRL